MINGISDKQMALNSVRFTRMVGDLILTYPHKLDFHGCYCERLKEYKDARGCLVELVKERSELTMSYCSYTDPTCARDYDRWHLHAVQTDRFFIMYGSCIFGLSFGMETVRLVMTDKEPYMLFIPPGVKHCFLAGAEGVLLINFPTQLFNPDDELRIPFKDVEAPYPWHPIEF